jgi:hypothetical protein
MSRNLISNSVVILHARLRIALRHVRLVVLLLLFIQILAESVTCASAQAQKYSKDQGYFYRFRASFEVKATGEPLDFDYVVACNIRLTRWRDGGLSDDSTYSPRAMVMATNGGQAVMLRNAGCVPRPYLGA